MTSSLLCHLCHQANFDLLHQPRNISTMSKKNVCFYMFVDAQTEGFLKKTGQLQKKAKKIGLWRLVVVQNLPFEDPRRNGKVLLVSGLSIDFDILIHILWDASVQNMFLMLAIHFPFSSATTSNFEFFFRRRKKINFGIQ